MELSEEQKGEMLYNLFTCFYFHFSVKGKQT